MMNNTEIIQIADRIVTQLKKAGFTIQRYDAYSTNSVYLKLDYGVCYTVRISDHKGKGGLQYRYNVLKTHQGTNYNKSGEGYARYYYGFDAIDQLIKDVTNHKNWRIRRYGQKYYDKLMQDNKASNKNNAGFWSKCFEV